MQSEKKNPRRKSLKNAGLGVAAFTIVTRFGSGGKGFDYPGRDLKLVWDSQNLKVINFDEVNQFVKREYRSGWNLPV